jgi:hypothetical protein
MRNRITLSRTSGPTGRRRADAAGTMQARAARNSRAGGGSSY